MDGLSESDQIALAIAQSLSEQEHSRATASCSESLPQTFDTIFEVQHCSKVHLRAGPIDSCPACGQAVQCSAIPCNVREPVPLSVVIVPTCVPWHRYDNNALLHCGFSDGDASHVYNFDERGVKKDAVQKRWKHVLSVPLDLSLAGVDRFRLSELLEEHYAREKQYDELRSRKHRYRQLQNNCFDFVVRFLNAISYGSATHTKDSVVSNFIARPVAEFEAFFHLHRALKGNAESVTRESIAPLLAQNATHSCDGCGRGGIERDTVWYRCAECVDLDLCERCEAIDQSQLHSADHVLIKHGS